MKIEYIKHRFRKSTLAVIHDCNVIVSEYQAQGYTMTLRGIYYQMIARDLFPSDWIDVAYNAKHGLDRMTKNTPKKYKRFGQTISKARKAGLTSWYAMEDVTRSLRGVNHWDTPEDMIASAIGSYKKDKWRNQPKRVEVWIEKEALINIIGRTCRELDVDFFACRGYGSDTAYWNASQRFRRYAKKGQKTFVIYLTDHDPSGIDMARDLRDRLKLFRTPSATVQRVALTMEQIERYSPPPNPAKTTDSRAAGYIRKFGRDSWELDALTPDVMNDLITRSVLAHRDEFLWKEMVADENADIAQLRSMIEQDD